MESRSCRHAPRAALSSCPIYTRIGQRHPRRKRTACSRTSRSSPSTPIGQRSPGGLTASRTQPQTPSHPRRAGSTSARSGPSSRGPTGRASARFQPHQRLVAAYLTARSDQGHSIATVRADRQAISAVHRELGEADPTGNVLVKRVLRGLARQRAGEGSRQASPLTAEGLAAIRATALIPRAGPTGRTESPEAARIRGAVDVAIASVMRDPMLRRSEAAALEWADVELRPDGSGRLRVRRSKTDQEGEGAVQYLGKGTAAALREIRPENQDPDARVFGLRSGRSVARRLATMARAAGLEGAFSGHSARVGMARDLVASGASVAAVQIAGRWASDRMPAYYARGELAARGAVARFYGE